jgi:hypothetical protein
MHPFWPTCSPNTHATCLASHSVSVRCYFWLPCASHAMWPTDYVDKVPALLQTGWRQGLMYHCLVKCCMSSGAPSCRVSGRRMIHRLSRHPGQTHPKSRRRHRHRHRRNLALTLMTQRRRRMLMPTPLTRDMRVTHGLLQSRGMTAMMSFRRRRCTCLLKRKWTGYCVYEMALLAPLALPLASRSGEGRGCQHSESRSTLRMQTLQKRIGDCQPACIRTSVLTREQGRLKRS